MLRSLYSAISGLRSHQTMLDVTGNNIANVNTTAFKSSAVQFQDTLSQLTRGAGAGSASAGGTNPAQIGLGVQVAGISTNFAQGSTQSTGRSGDMMISGDGFFVVQSGAETLYTRSGAFDFDDQGRLITKTGALVQGWAAQGGAIDTTQPLGAVTLPQGAASAAQATGSATVTGNLPSDAATGTEVKRQINVYDATGAQKTLELTFTKSAAGWDVAGATDAGASGTGSMTFTDGALTAGGTLAVGGISVDLSAVSGYATLNTVSIAHQDGYASGTLQSWSLSDDGTLVGAFSNGTTQPIARIALATFVNPGGLEKAGSSDYRTSVNSGAANVGSAKGNGFGSIVGSALEMSNVDLSQEFTNLIVAQRGFQANARMITTSDEVLQELTNLKR